MAASPEQRIPELDSVRGLAAFAVLLCHLPRGFWLGEHGVDVFFVLSGFLITGILLRNRGQPGLLKNFYARRGLRIWPIYYLLIPVIYLINSRRGHPSDTSGLPWYLLYAQNIWAYWGGPNRPFPHFWHTWTLAIEEQFYLLWPALAVLLSLRGVRWAAVVAAILPFGLRAGGLDRVTLFGHSDGLALGALLALYIHHGAATGADRRRDAPWFGAIALLGATGYFVAWRATSAAGMTGRQLVESSPGIGYSELFSLGLVGFVVLTTGSSALAMLRTRPLRKLGEISYGLYLYHWVLYELLDIKIKFGLRLGEPWWSDLIKVVLSIVVAMGSWRYLEQPILRLKDRFAYRPEAA